ncbi:Major Facilitator Superfamily [Rubrobacter radiotolerans]|uniref:Putative proline/betaine transporter n=1 Tax=Rubrobacter radiotolerans TaxID=42256 RepID=A0A023X093_RUBRA|nr:MFS transporter [Rubrobacter radiotolerans]AHY45902.1 Major Facilitator Superfamily [Rubrobacter radiotolerans]MDX5893316.1 MFS transporter [Rubrobacter radiotolerans]SMC03490.1 metabolite-proton symporter [Rubrobacter radiotolerans DSM 5868]
MADVSGEAGQQPVRGAQIRKVAAASFIGTTIEWYDFFVYGTAAALVFGVLFFPEFSPTAGTLAAFSTFAVGFFARPVGGVIFGHYGDRIGRKTMLILALMIMGVATVGIGLLPTYESIGVWAPILLVLLRFCQGLGIGGEWGGAVLMAVEHAPPGKRGFYGSWPQMGVPAGLILANIAFLAVAALPEEAFLAWGWRVPFIASIVLVVVGLFIRLAIMESPSFHRVQESNTQARIPIVDVLRMFPKQVLLAAGAFIVINAYFYILVSYLINYATEAAGMSRPEILTILVISSVVSFFAIPAFAMLSDRVGRRPLYLVGCVLMGISAFPLFWATDTASFWLVLPAHIFGLGALSIAYGPQAAMYAEAFATRVRYSGISLGYQGGSIFGGALAPIIATSLFAATGTSTSIALYVLAIAVLSFVCAYLFTETYQTDIDAEHEAEKRLIEEAKEAEEAARR